MNWKYFAILKIWGKIKSVIDDFIIAATISLNFEFDLSISAAFFTFIMKVT